MNEDGRLVVTGSADKVRTTSINSLHGD